MGHLADSIAKLSQGRENWDICREGVPVDDSSRGKCEPGLLLFFKIYQNHYMGLQFFLEQPSTTRHSCFKISSEIPASSYLEFQVSKPKLENVLCFIILPISKRKQINLSFQMYHLYGHGENFILFYNYTSKEYLRYVIM